MKLAVEGRIPKNPADGYMHNNSGLRGLDYIEGQPVWAALLTVKKD